MQCSVFLNKEDVIISKAEITMQCETAILSLENGLFKDVSQKF
jgi:hypothetical protein